MQNSNFESCIHPKCWVPRSLRRLAMLQGFGPDIQLWPPAYSLGNGFANATSRDNTALTCVSWNDAPYRRFPDHLEKEAESHLQHVCVPRIPSQRLLRDSPFPQQGEKSEIAETVWGARYLRAYSPLPAFPCADR